jgi:hypothetical protein
MLTKMTETIFPKRFRLHSLSLIFLTSYPDSIYYLFLPVVTVVMLMSFIYPLENTNGIDNLEV